MDASVTSIDEIKFNAFSESEIAILKLFHEQFIQISESSFINTGEFNSSLTIQIIRMEKEIDISHQGPEEANIRSILLLIRPIKLQNDETNIRIERILGVLKDRSANEETRLYIQHLIRNYKDRSNEPSIKLRGRYGEYDEMKIFDLWMNGYYFHKDSAKRRELDDLMEWPQMAAVVKDILLKPTFRINTPIHNIFCSLARVDLALSPESRSNLFAAEPHVGPRLLLSMSLS